MIRMVTGRQRKQKDHLGALRVPENLGILIYLWIEVLLPHLYESSLIRSFRPILLLVLLDFLGSIIIQLMHLLH